MDPIYNYSEQISVDWNPEFKEDAIIFGQKLSHLFPNSSLTDTTKFIKKAMFLFCCQEKILGLIF